jgi:hypothetical protein
MSSDQIGVTTMGICFLGVGLKLRKQQSKNWKAFLIGGIAMLALVILSFVFGWSL